MRKSVTWAAIGAGAAAILLSGVVTGVAQDKMGLIKARQDFMKAQGKDVKAISDYSKGQGDKAAAEKAVDDLIARNPKIVDQFPAGTSATDFPGKTWAKPELWTDWDKAKMIPDALLVQEKKLKEVIATGDPKAVAAQLGAAGKAGCGACHNAYRLPET
ncbi:MAG TPA: cytochrome c [Stellaceae bacterium]|nr:cytochrome c [Stellaceae bacterium]